MAVRSLYRNNVILDKYIKALVFDMAGTTVNERGLVYKTLYSTIKNFNLDINNEDEINKWQGANKYEVLDHYLKKTHKNPKYFTELQPKLHKIFNNNLIENYSDPNNLSLINDGIPDLFNTFRETNIKIFLNTGYSKEVQESIIESLNMKDFIDDYISSDLVQRGRPHPDMIYKLMTNNNIRYTKQIIKFGDTINDIREGINANCCKSVGVLSGAGDKKTLQKAGASRVINSVMDIELQ